MPLGTDAVLVSVPAAARKFPDLRRNDSVPAFASLRATRVTGAWRASREPYQDLHTWMPWPRDLPQDDQDFGWEIECRGPKLTIRPAIRPPSLGHCYRLLASREL
jgi:hypothetical protein